MIDPTVSAAATATLEAAINRALHYDPATRLRLQALAGKSLAIQVRELPLSICCHFDEDRVRLSSHIDQPSVCLRGSLPGLLMLAGGERVNLADSGVEAWGNTALLAEVKSIASELELDWEEALNDWLGDLLGHPLAAGLRSQWQWLRDRAHSGRRLLSEFLTEELRATPGAAELEYFNRQVDQLRLAGDRLNARVDRLRHKLQTRRRPASPTSPPQQPSSQPAERRPPE